MDKLYRLDIDEVLSDLSLFTHYDIGGEGHGVIVKKEHLHDAIEEIVDNFSALIEDSFEAYDEMEEE